MNWVDIAIIFVIAVTSLYSLMWGFVRQLMLAACFALGLYVALNFSGSVFENFTRSWVDNETIGRTLAWGLLFVGTFVLAAILTIPLFRLVRARSIRFLDHLVGLFFGFVLGWAIAGLGWIGVVLTFQIKADDATVQQTRLLPYVHTTSMTMLELAEKAPFLQSSDTQLMILDAFEAMHMANPLLGRDTGDSAIETGGLIQAGAAVPTGLSGASGASGASSPTMQAVDLVDDDPIARLISLTQTQASNASQDQSGGQRDIQNQNQNTDQTGSGN